MNLEQQKNFSEIVYLISSSKQKAFSSVNTILIELYRNIGEHISKKTIKENWGKGIVQELANFIAQKELNLQGFTARNLWRMKQFYETYQGNEKLSTLLTQLSWSNNLLILSALKSEQEREFYVNLCLKERYSYRDVKKEYENPSIGVLLCRQKDDEVVEYAMSRSLSPTVISQYETRLIPKELLKQKLNQFYEHLDEQQSALI